MIEVVSSARCVACDVCVRVCPTDVFDPGPGGVPVIARRSDCQTCYLCEAYCPVDALFVAPQREPLPAGSALGDEAELTRRGLIGGYRAVLGWGNGRRPGARYAVGPPLRDETERTDPAPGPASGPASGTT